MPRHICTTCAWAQTRLVGSNCRPRWPAGSVHCCRLSAHSDSRRALRVQNTHFIANSIANINTCDLAIESGVRTCAGALRCSCRTARASKVELLGRLHRHSIWQRGANGAVPLEYACNAAQQGYMAGYALENVRSTRSPQVLLSARQFPATLFRSRKPFTGRYSP